MIRLNHSPVDRVEVPDFAMKTLALTGEDTRRILFICISNRLAAMTADSQYG